MRSCVAGWTRCGPGSQQIPRRRGHRPKDGARSERHSGRWLGGSVASLQRRWRPSAGRRAGRTGNVLSVATRTEGVGGAPDQAMTMIVSAFGIVGRFAGDLLTSALGWASSLLFGRVPRSHQIFLVLMMAASFLWIVLVLGLLVPSIASWGLAATPHPPFVATAWLGAALLFGVILLPLGVGLAGFLVPAEGERPAG